MRVARRNSRNLKEGRTIKKADYRNESERKPKSKGQRAGGLSGPHRRPEKGRGCRGWIVELGKGKSMQPWSHVQGRARSEEDAQSWEKMVARGEPPGEEEHGPAGRRQQEPQHVWAGEQGLHGREKKGGREAGKGECGGRRSSGGGSVWGQHGKNCLGGGE